MSGEQDRIDIAQAAAQQLRAIGINCTVEIPAQMDWGGQMACLIGWGSPFDADDHTYKVFGTDKGANYSGYSNAAGRRGADQGAPVRRPGGAQGVLRRLPAGAGGRSGLCLHLLHRRELRREVEHLQGIDTDTVLGHHGVGIFWNVQDWDNRLTK